MVTLFAGHGTESGEGNLVLDIRDSSSSSGVQCESQDDEGGHLAAGAQGRPHQAAPRRSCGQAAVCAHAACGLGLWPSSNWA